MSERKYLIGDTTIDLTPIDCNERGPGKLEVYKDKHFSERCIVEAVYAERKNGNHVYLGNFPISPGQYVFYKCMLIELVPSSVARLVIGGSGPGKARRFLPERYI